MTLRIIKDKVFDKTFFVITLIGISFVFFIAVGLFIKSYPILEKTSLSHLLLSSEWKTFQGKFGFLPFIMGTLWVTVIAMVITLPLSILSAVYLSEYASRKIRNTITPLIDLLAAIPPIIYGVWGVLVIVPLIGDKIAPHFVEFSTGYSVLAGGVILAVMTFPLIVNLLMEIFQSIPRELRDASLSLGATEWQTSKKVLLRKAMPGIIAATVLAISRAFGETIAVLMVCGNLPEIPHSIFDSGYPLPALIANNYGEMMSIPLYDSALMLAAFILFIIIFFFNAISRFILYKIEGRLG